MRRGDVLLLIVAATAAIVLGVLSTLGMALAAGAFARPLGLARHGTRAAVYPH
jgi:hypothetical protein